MDWLDLLAVQGILSQLASAGSWVVQPGTGLTLRIQAQAALSTPEALGRLPSAGLLSPCPRGEGPVTGYRPLADAVDPVP